MKPISSFYCILLTCALTSCGIYSFRDVSIPPEVKTVKIGYIENKASYVNPQLSPQLTSELQRKVTSQTRLTRTTNDDAHYQISGYVSGYSVTTAGVSQQKTAVNRLTVSVHIMFKNTLNNKDEEFDVSRDFDFDANLTLAQEEAKDLKLIIDNLTDEIFNRIFSNW